MRFTNLLTRPAAPVAELAGATACRPCTTEQRHCHETLVLHADGTAHCDDAHRCEAREDLHEWWIPCTDLTCGCAGDEHPEPLLLAA